MKTHNKDLRTKTRKRRLENEDPKTKTRKRRPKNEDPETKTQKRRPFRDFDTGSAHHAFSPMKNNLKLDNYSAFNMIIHQLMNDHSSIDQ